MSSANENSYEQVIPGVPMVAVKDYDHLQPHDAGRCFWLIAHLGRYLLADDGCSGIACGGSLRGLELHQCLMRDGRFWKASLPVNVRGFMRAPPSSWKGSEILERISEGKQCRRYGMESMPDAGGSSGSYLRRLLAKHRPSFRKFG